MLPRTRLASSPVVQWHGCFLRPQANRDISKPRSAMSLVSCPHCPSAAVLPGDICWGRRPYILGQV